MISCVVAGHDGEGVVRTVSHNLHLLLILQPEGSPFLTGQLQVFELQFCLAVGLEDELPIIALATQGNGEFVSLKGALHTHVRTFHRHFHTILHLLLHLGCRAIELNGDVFGMTHTHSHECPYASHQNLSDHIPII